MNITSLLQLLSGKKTYFTSAAIIGLLIAQWAGWLKIDPAVYTALMAAAVAFLRAGIAKGPDDSQPTAPAGTATSSMKLPLMLALACLTLTLFTTGALMTGCGTTPQKVAYQAAGTTTVSVDTAMSLWGAYVAANHPPVAQEAAVKAAYEKYQASMATACDAGAIYAATSVTNAPGLSKASLALQQATSTAGQELTDLETLISSFGVKLQ